MTGEPVPRPVPRAVRVVAILLALVAILLLTLGGLTTSFRAGMADPVWPTEPWYLIVNGNVWQESRTGFLLEHTHRAAGWVVGGLASLLALAAWGAARGATRVVGLGLIAVLLASYGDYHRRMMAAWDARVAGQVMERPRVAEITTATLAGLFALWCLIHLFGRDRGKWVRAVAGFLLVAVMIQGLLGGLRVFLDQLIGLKYTVGVELSALHGLFAQLVFSAMVCVPILAARPRPEFDLPAADRSRLGWLSLALVGVTVLQLLWAVWVRHAPTPLAQRLHFLTAFAVLGLAVWLTARALGSAAGRKALGFAAWHLIGVLGVQIVLGVEAWMGKFAATGAFADRLPEARPITVESGVIRTLHQLIGTAVLATAVVIALRVYRRTAPAEVPAATGTVAGSDPRSRAEGLAPISAGA